MSSKILLIITAGTALGAVAVLLAASGHGSALKHKKVDKSSNSWNDNTTKSFTGWLEILKLEIDKDAGILLTRDN